MTDTLIGCPNWNHWRNMHEVKLCEAVALSLNLNPDALPWDRFDGKFEAGAEFDSRLRIAVSHASGSSLRVLAHTGTAHNSPVNLRVFAVWAAGIWEDLPIEIQAIAQSAAPAATPEPIQLKPPAASVGVPKQRAQERRIIELITAQGYVPLELAQRAPGKPGPKSEIRTLALNEPQLFTAKTFDTAWQRLRDAGELAGAE